MRNYILAAVFPSLFLASGMPSQAETDLTGTWVGQFKGVFITTSPIPQGLFSSRPYEEARREERKPRFIELPVTASIEKQQDGLLYGRWVITEAVEGLRRGDKFVCAMTDPNIWSCIDPGGTIKVEVQSPTEIEICYFANDSYGQGAGCALFKKD